MTSAAKPQRGGGPGLRLVEAWYAPRLTALTLALLPLAWLFAAAVAARRALFDWGILSTHRVGVPVVIVGNIAIGGTGKTPVTMALARALAARGHAPGIVSRGHGGTDRGPRLVSANDDPGAVGDEALLHARTGFPVAIGRDRAAAARFLRARHPHCSVIVADDGLQHYALARDVELVVVDGARGFGNGRPLPAGPLREPVRRLRAADAVVIVDGTAGALEAHSFAARLTGDRFVCLADGRTVAADALPPGRVHALAGIGHPERFFAHLRRLGLDPVTHAFPDHHAYAAHDVALAGADVILLTEKDAVKCARFADARFWMLPVAAELDPALVALVEQKIGRSQAA